MSLLRPNYQLEVMRVAPKWPTRAAVEDGEDARVGSRLVVLRNAAGEEQNPVAKVLGAVRKGVRWLINGPTVDEFKTRVVYDDPDTRWASAAEIRAAAAAVREKKALEDAAVARLGPRAEAYRKAAELCSADPIAREALMRMLLDGRLVGKRDLRGEGDMLDHLARVVNGPLAPGLDRRELTTSLIEEVENPVKIAQEGKGTCVATSATIVMARQNATEYARLVADLAHPTGTTRTFGGAALQRHKDWANTNDYGRTPSVKLLQPALMEHGNGWLRYNNDKDAHTLGGTPLWDRVKGGWLAFREILSNIPIVPGGLDSRGANKLLEALTGDDWSQIFLVTRLNRESAFRRVEAALAAGDMVPVGLEWEGGGHKVIADKIEDGKVYITNPWGQRETIGVEEFKQNLMDANFRKR